MSLRRQRVGNIRRLTLVEQGEGFLEFYPLKFMLSSSAKCCDFPDRKADLGGNGNFAYQRFVLEEKREVISLWCTRGVCASVELTFRLL